MSNIDTQHFLAFLNTWVHDVRSPLASIAASAEILEQHGSNAALDRNLLVGLIARNNYRVTEEVDFLADYWRLHYVVEPIQPVPLPLPALVEQAQLGLGRLLPEQMPAINLVAPAGLPQILTDEWLVKAFINLLFLLANTDVGPATRIQLSASRAPGNQLQIQLSGHYATPADALDGAILSCAWEERYTFAARIITHLYDGGIQPGATPDSLCYRLQLPTAP